MPDQNPIILNAEESAAIDSELLLHAKVKEAVRKEALATSPDMNVIKTRLVELRDQAISASEHDLPSIFQQLYTHHSLAARSFEKKLPDMRSPYFAHIQLLEQGKYRDILLGYQTFIDTTSNITIIDWRNAALAKVFFNYKEGDDFELELPGRIASGTLAMRRVVTFEIGELVALNSPTVNLMRERGGTWRRMSGTLAADLSGGSGTAVNVQQFGVGAGQRRLPDVSALLDPEQYAILSRDQEEALLILGGAGSGKTTVALHRMALLAYKKPRFYHAHSMQVVVPEQGLVRLTERLLAALGMIDVPALTFDAWVNKQGRQILKGLPKRLCHWTPSQVIFCKRHPAMKTVLAAYVGQLQHQVHKELAFLVEGWDASIATEFLNSPLPLIPRLDISENRVSARLEGERAAPGTSWRRETMARFFKQSRRKLLDVDTARSELFASAALLQILSENSQGQITGKMTAELLRHTRKQFEDPHGGQDDHSVRGVKTIDEAELEEDDYTGTMDVEDFPVLLGLMRRLHGRVQRKTQSLSEYKHLLIDEAQDLGTLEFELLGQSLGEDATVTVAGDAVQQSDATISFAGWDEVLSDLGVAETHKAQLRTNYRSPRPIAELAHQLLGKMAPAELPRSLRDGRPVIFSRVPTEGLAMVAIADTISQLLNQEPLATVAIICENEDGARHFFDSLRSQTDVRLVIDGEFSFKPGIDVTCVAQVKGLEFDYVILPDVNLNVYPDTPVARRSLHIAVTRAVHQLWLISVGKVSDILATIS